MSTFSWKWSQESQIDALAQIPRLSRMQQHFTLFPSPHTLPAFDFPALLIRKLIHIIVVFCGEVNDLWLLETFRSSPFPLPVSPWCFLLSVWLKGHFSSNLRLLENKLNLLSEKKSYSKQTQWAALVAPYTKIDIYVQNQFVVQIFNLLPRPHIPLALFSITICWSWQFATVVVKTS